MDMDELAEKASGIFREIPQLAQDAATCERVCKQFWQGKTVPESYLSNQWLTMANAVPQFGNNREFLDAALMSLRSIALCMRATGFQRSELFMSVAERMCTNIATINAMEDACLKDQSQGGTLQ